MWDRENPKLFHILVQNLCLFNTNRLIRNIIWQTKSAFRLNDVMDEWKFYLLIYLKVKYETWMLSFWVWFWFLKFIQHYGSWENPGKDRKDFYLYVDEFQNFVSGTFADILSEARKYRLCLIMAHQYIAQLEAWQWLNRSEWWKWDVKVLYLVMWELWCHLK